MGSAFRSVLNRVVLASLLFSLFIGASTFLAAQDVASLTGVVTDQTGAVISGVETPLRNPQTAIFTKLSPTARGPNHSVKYSLGLAITSNSSTMASKRLSSPVFT